jgi:hypothetical protein
MRAHDQCNRRTSHAGTTNRPATAADFHRLADLAHERGLRLFRDGSRWYCSSASEPGSCHYVTGLSCDCAGFISHQRCTHHALLLERLGWLPEVESDLPYVEASAIDCPDCCGCGLVDYGRYNLPWETCGGSGVRPSHHLHDAPVHPMVAAAA